MSQKIIAFSGVKQSGKTTCLNFLHGCVLKRNDVIEKFFVDEETGSIMVNTISQDETGEDVKSMGNVDFGRTDDEFIEYAHINIWPFIKPYNFADPLKNIAMNLFGLTYAQCYGSDKDKNSKTNIKWEDMPENFMVEFDKEYYDIVPEKNGIMSSREFLQHFGTNICRKIHNNVWVETCIKRIKNEQTEFAIIGDCRFENEVEAIQKAGGKVIRLTRRTANDLHASETALDKENFDWDKFDLIIDNKNMSINECNKALFEALQNWGWF